MVIVIAIFVAANFAYQSALVFYNALLPTVSVGRGAGRVSGYGVAAGYVGSILILVIFTFLVTDAEAVRSFLGPLGGWIEVGEQRNSNAFLPTAILYLLFSLPAFFFVPDPAVRTPRRVSPAAVYRDVFATIRNIRGYTGVGTFIIATALYTDAANTAVANMALYGNQVFGMTTGEIQNLLLLSAVFAAAGSVGFGSVSDRAGPKKTLLVVPRALARFHSSCGVRRGPLDAPLGRAARRGGARRDVDRQPGSARGALAAGEAGRVLRALHALSESLRGRRPGAHGGTARCLRGARYGLLPDRHRLAPGNHAPRHILSPPRPRRPAKIYGGRVLSLAPLARRTSFMMGPRTEEVARWTVRRSEAGW